MNKSDAINQRIVARLVEREVLYCVSSLISRLAELEPDNEELFDLSERRDYETPLEDVTEEQWVELAKNNDYHWTTAHKDRLISVLGAAECCDQLGLDPHYIEVYEHHIITGWAADKLRGLGQVVVDDVYGLTVWGRCTTGQSSSLDHVWWQIAAGMGILAGQPNSWADKA